jgi:hypothetical protein
MEEYDDKSDSGFVVAVVHAGVPDNGGEDGDERNLFCIFCESAGNMNCTELCEWVVGEGRRGLSVDEEFVKWPVTNLNRVTVKCERKR